MTVSQLKMIKDKLTKGDRFAALVGARLVEVREGYSRVELEVGEEHINAAGVCQGGVIFTMADFAFAAVANSRGIVTLGISNTITFISSAKLGDHLVAECVEVVNHHRLPYCEIKVTNQEGAVVAAVTGLAYRLKKEICEF